MIETRQLGICAGLRYKEDIERFFLIPQPSTNAGLAGFNDDQIVGIRKAGDIGQAFRIRSSQS